LCSSNGLLAAVITIPNDSGDPHRSTTMADADVDRRIVCLDRNMLVQPLD